MIVGVPPVSSLGRVVVVSPHLDDGVLSLGASIASFARQGASVELLTVLACDPESTAPAGGWDRRGGFATEGESAQARREEDRRACATLGATPVWLPFGSVDYERHGDDTEVRDAVASAVADAELVLLPGHPLTHPDHAWLARLLERRARIAASPSTPSSPTRGARRGRRPRRAESPRTTCSSRST